MQMKMKIGTRIIFGFSMLLIMMITMIIFALSNMTQVNIRLERIVKVNNYKIQLSYKMSESFRQVAESVKGISGYTDQQLINRETNKASQASEDYETAYNALLLTQITSEKGQLLSTQLKDLVATAKPLNDQVLQLAMAKKNAEAMDLWVKEADPATQAVLDTITQFIIVQEGLNQADAADAARAYGSSYSFLIISGILAILLGLFLTYFITRSITKPVNKIVSSLNDSSNQVAAASGQLSSAAQQLSQGSAEQASAIEETSSTLQESTSMLQQNTVNTKQAAQLSEQAKESADKGSNGMQEMMNSMIEIKKSSDQIAKIIKVIDDIAFQTNILALNAAIEAARAGEAGMGFAVVAEEVRNLAGRSAEAAKNTTAMIESNIELSGKGVSVAERVREVLTEITGQARKVNELMNEISVASVEQVQGVEQVNKAMTQMESVTGQNAASAEESASAAEELNAQADSMKKIVRELSELVNGAVSVSVLNNKNVNIGHEIPHLSPNSNQQPVKTIETTLQNSAHQEPVPNTLLTDKAKTKVISPEDIIPLEKDPNRF
jgi:methyl-accepting chemotaxis protein